MSFIINPYSFGFNPLSLSPALWLSDTGSDPAVWSDISGNGRNATQATAANQPDIITGGLNGRQVRRFNGSNDWLVGTMTLAQPMTTIAVARSNNTANTQAIFHGNNAVFGYVYGGAFIYAAALLYTGAVNTSYNILSYKLSSTASNIYINGIQGIAGNAGAAGITSVTVGRNPNGTEYLNGDIAEILIFPTALSNTNRQAVESYLRTKWGTP